MRKIMLFILMSLLTCTTLAQDRNLTMRILENQQQRPVNDQVIPLNTLSVRKSPGHYTKEQWRELIDSTWGTGISTGTKLSVFDTYWNAVDQLWGGFPNLTINWDSLKAVYRPQVEAGVSRGRFAGILSRLTRELNEWHVGVIDLGIDSSMNYYPDFTLLGQYPNYSSFHYQPGIPLIDINILFWRTNFGAGISLVDDSIITVYSVMPNHPLSLEPGDIILGYDGIPWKELIKELFDAEIPILGSDLCGNRLGSSNSSSFHTVMISAGMNWGLFDTIDVKKYSTNEIIHFPTSLLSTINPPYHIATEQLPVKGVSFPDIQNNKFVSWGVVDGTSIGYIYLWDWCGKPQGQTKDLFSQAVDELMHKQKVKGLILDFRTNAGGWPEYANPGFSHLFNSDPTYNYSRAIRTIGSDHLAFSLQQPRIEERFTPTTELFDYPIAVLTGPLCGSSGDYNAFRLRFHPMTRFFGKPASGAYTDLTDRFRFGTIAGPYFYRVDDASIYSNYQNEGFMIHKPFPVDEEVWLTREGIAKGEDDVVKRALEWINNLVYGHTLTKNKSYCYPGTDTLKISALVENPNSHQTLSKVYIKNLTGNFIDSLELNKTGLSDSSEIWMGNYLVPALEDFFSIFLSAKDIDESKTWITSNISRFTTAGPLTVDSIEYKKIGSLYYVKPFVKNRSSILTIKKCKVNISSDDPWVISITEVNLPDIPPRTIMGSSSMSLIRYDSTFPGYFNLKFKIMSDGWVYWIDTKKMVVTGVNEETIKPISFRLEQNYPNPFNPTTTIKYSILKQSYVILKIYNILGKETMLLVNEEKPAGNYQVEFNATNLPSGVYFYRIQAGSFNQVRKMLLIK